MMNNGPPEKRPRHEPPPPPPPPSGPWQPPQDTSRQLPSLSHTFPPPPQEHAPPYQQHGLPFSTRPPEPAPHIADRRTSEHAPPPPWEHPDHRRPSSGPSHGYQAGPPSQLPPFGGPREVTMVKRDPAEDTPQHQYRPNSTGHGPEHNVNAPHHEPPRPFHPPPSYDPAHARTQPYASYPQPHTGSPVSASNPYHPSYGRPDLPPPSDHQYSSVSYPNTGNRPTSEQVRKKAQRAAQACDSCRTLKAKCDEGRPSCSSCKEKNIECRYRDPPPKQQDKASADIMDGLARIENNFSSFNTKFEYLTNEVNEIKRVQKHILQSIPNAEATFKEEATEAVQLGMTAYSAPSVRAESQVLTSESPYGSTPGQLRLLERPDHPIDRIDPHLERSESILDQMELPRPREEEEEEESGGDPGPPKDSSIPINHTTGAARLLLLGPIADMCKDAISSTKIRNEKYPIQQETKRGMLRLFGRGEGGDCPPGYDKDPSTDHGEGTPGDAQSDVSTPPAGEEWGQLGGLTPPPSTGEITRGGISPEGMPDLSRETVYVLIRAYLDNMNIMHPILIPNHLFNMVETFLKNIPESQQARPKQVVTLAGHAPPVGFLGGGGYRNPESPGQKRKRSPVPGEYPDPPQPILSLQELKPSHPFRTINTAIVLLVMSLGAVCLYKGKIPEANSEKDLDSDNLGSSYSSSPTMKNGHPQSPLQTSPIGIPSPQDMDRTQSRSRRTSIEGGLNFPARAKPKNIDRMPGLAYFAFATDILGNQLGGNSLQHVHAHILAGLYHSLLARIMESAAYIANASRILQVILRPKLDRFRKLKAKTEIASAKDNPVIFAFWTCLQLESDIVAELPCPHSGILTYEEDMPTPNYIAAISIDGFDHRIIESYSAQLFLRKHLNQLHNMFYKPDNSLLPTLTSKPPEHFPTIEASQQSLDSIDKVAPTMLWDVRSGELAKDILGARLRAKYYGAQVITYRPFVLNILEMSSTPSNSTEQISTQFMDNIQAPKVGRNTKRLEDVHEKVREYARYGLQATIHSTRAFYGVGNPGQDRLIVTNIWGTAHAQWGNLLVLQAAWKNRILRPILDELLSTEELIFLLKQTLALLKLVGSSTSALYMDYHILKRAGTNNGLLGPANPQGPNTASSFSSTTTGDVSMGGH